MRRVVELDAVATHDLRRRVLRGHLAGAAVGNPEDDLATTTHLGLVDEDGTLVAIATLFPEPSQHRPGVRAGRLRGMAVEPDRQGRGLGALLLAAVVERARLEGYEALWANGRDGALGFYTRHGWAVEGPGFTTMGLPHHVVVRDL